MLTDFSQYNREDPTDKTERLLPFLSNQTDTKVDTELDMKALPSTSTELP